MRALPVNIAFDQAWGLALSLSFGLAVVGPGLLAFSWCPLPVALTFAHAWGLPLTLSFGLAN